MIKKLVIVLAAVMAVAVVAALIFVATLDINDYRGVVAAELEELTGRKLEISGDLELVPSLRPSVIVHDARFANAPWGTRPAMISAARVEAQIALLPLLSRRIEVLRIGLFDVDVLLETDAQGRGNWDVLPKSDTGAGAGAPAEFKIDGVQIEQLKFAYRDGATGDVFDATLPRLTLSPKNEDELNIAVEAVYRNATIRVDGSIGRLRRLLQSSPYPLDLGIRLGAAELSIQGEIAKPLEGRGLDLAFTAKVPDLAALSEVAGTALPAIEAIALEGELAGAPDALALSNVAVSVGEARFNGEFELRMDGVRPRLVGKLSTPALDVDRLRAGRKQESGIDQPASGARRDKVFSTDPLPIGLLEQVDAEFAFRIERLVANGVEAKDVHLDLVLDDGHLTLTPMTVRIGESMLEAALDLKARPAPPALEFQFTAPGLDVGALVGKVLASDALEGKVDIDVKVKGRGASVAALMGSLDGHARLLMADGRAKAGKQLELLIGGVTTLVGTMTADPSEWTQLNCVAVDFEIEQGIASKKVMLLDTDVATVVGEGSIDLGKETIAMTVTPSPKSVTLNVAVPVKVGGTLANPTFRPDELATARRVGGLALMLFPPAALASLGSLALNAAGAVGAAGDIGAGGDHPCLDIAAGEAQPASMAAPADTEKPQAKQKKDEDGLLEGIGNTLKGLFGN